MLFDTPKSDAVIIQIIFITNLNILEMAVFQPRIFFFIQMIY